MASRPSNREEEFELVLGNKQLLSLFFIVVGFFAAFFSVGYMVGFGHGEKTGSGSGIARAEEPAPKPPEPRLPETLLQDPPAPPAPAPTAAQSKPSPTSAASALVPDPRPEPAAQTAAARAPKQTTPVQTPPAVPATAPEAKPKPAPAPAAKAASGGSYTLQVAALRTQADAAQLAAKLKAKGYPATVSAGQGDGWQRVMVGPFDSSEAAQAFKAKLTKDGFDTMLRKL